MDKANSSASNKAAGSTNSPGASVSTVNIEQLAAKVYQLMLEDARLAHARGAARRARK